MRAAADTGQLWRLTLQHSPVGMALVSLEGGFMAVNDALCDLLGRGHDDLTALSFQELTHPDDLEVDLHLLKETLAGERTSYRMRKRYLHAAGHVVWGDLSVALVRDDAGLPLHFISQVLDVTQQQQYESRLAEAAALIDHQRRLNDAIFEAVDVGLVLHDRDGHYRKVNRQHRHFQQLAFPEGHRGQVGQIGFVYDEDMTRPLEREELPSYRSSMGEEFDNVLIWAGEDPANRRALSVSSRMVRDATGEVSGAALAYQDVTDLIRALQIKDDFVTTVSHELRTPLASVLGYLEILGDSDELTEPVRRQVGIIERNAERLQRLVGDILHVAQGSEGLVLQRTPADLATLARDSAHASHTAATSAGVKVSVEAPASLVSDVDGPRVRQVVDHLVNNAVKYAAGGRVVVRLALERSEVVLEVADDGIGMAPDEVDHAFTRFWRGREAQERQIPGTGLGLSIVEQIVCAHGGEVSLSSEPGVGTTVRVVLPHLAV